MRVDSASAGTDRARRLWARMKTASQATAASTSAMPASRAGLAPPPPGEKATAITPSVASPMASTRRSAGRSPSTTAESSAAAAGSVPATMPASDALDSVTPRMSSTEYPTLPAAACTVSSTASRRPTRGSRWPRQRISAKNTGSASACRSTVARKGSMSWPMTLLATTVLPTSTIARLHSSWPLSESDMTGNPAEVVNQRPVCGVWRGAS